MRIPLAVIGTVALCTLAACGSDGAHTTAPNEAYNPYGLTTTGPGVLSVTPLDTTTIFAVSPLGSLAPPGHVLPTDHIYISFVDPWSGSQQNNDCRARPVRAAGSGVIDFIIVTEAQGDTKVDVQMTKTFHYYYDHVLLKPGMVLGTRVNAGDTIATTTGRCPSMDLGVFDFDFVPSGFVNTKRYAGGSLHVVPPLRYFIEPLRSFLYSRVRTIDGVPADKDGRTDFGVRGKLVGDWFVGGVEQDAFVCVRLGFARAAHFDWRYHQCGGRNVDCGNGSGPRHGVGRLWNRCISGHVGAWPESVRMGARADALGRAATRGVFRDSSSSPDGVHRRRARVRALVASSKSRSWVI